MAPLVQCFRRTRLLARAQRCLACFRRATLGHFICYHSNSRQTSSSEIFCAQLRLEAQVADRALLQRAELLFV